MKLFVVVVVVVVISTLTFLVDANGDVAGIDTVGTVGTTNASISTGSISETDIIKPVIKKKRAWTLFHRILPSTTSNKISEKIHLSSLEWVRRGTINLTIIEPKLTNDEPVSLEILNDEDALSESFIDDIRMLDSITNTTTWYQLKIVDDTSKSDDQSQQQQLLTSVPSCSVLRSNFRDEILIQFQSVRNSNIISITYIPYISRFAPKKCMDYVPIVASSTTTPTAVASSTTPTSTSNETAMNQTKYQFISKISWETAVPGMIVGKPQLLDPTTNLPIVSATNMKIKPPPGYHWFPNAITNRRNSASSSSSGGGGKGSTPNDNDDENADEQAKQDNSPFGFFRKYYYIFIPLMILNLINSMNPPPPPSSSQQQQQQPGGSSATSTGTPGRAAAVVAGTTAAAAAAATTTTVGQGQVRQRRGKKD